MSAPNAAPPAAWALTLACVAAVGALLVAERRGDDRGRAVFKLSASAAFVLLAWTLGAAASVPGRWLLAALALGALGDACLLGRADRAFLAGLGAFLLSHVFFAASFVAGGIAPGPTLAAAAGCVAVGAGVGRWLGPHVPPAMRAPVAVYVVAILAMLALSFGAAAAGRGALVAAGAAAFAASDLAVARERFVQPSPLNPTWGLPTYYAAQLMLAWSVVR